MTAHPAMGDVLAHYASMVSNHARTRRGDSVIMFSEHYSCWGLYFRNETPDGWLDYTCVAPLASDKHFRGVYMAKLLWDAGIAAPRPSDEERLNDLWKKYHGTKA